MKGHYQRKRGEEAKASFVILEFCRNLYDLTQEFFMKIILLDILVN